MINDKKIVFNKKSDVKCPVCENYSFNSVSFPGSYLICEICYWEDDLLQYENPNYNGGANKVSLNEARDNFRLKSGAKGL